MSILCRIAAGEGDSIEHLTSHRRLHDMHIVHHRILIMLEDTVIDHKAVGKVTAAHPDIFVLHIFLIADDKDTGTVSHIKGNIERLTLITLDVYIMTGREQADTMTVYLLAARLYQLQAVFTVSAIYKDGRLFHHIGQSQVMVILGRKVQFISGLACIHNMVIKEAEVAIGKEREIHVVGIFPEYHLQGVLQQVGHLCLKAIPEHRLQF